MAVAEPLLFSSSQLLAGAAAALDTTPDSLVAPRRPQSSNCKIVKVGQFFWETVFWHLKKQQQPRVPKNLLFPI